MTLWKRQTVGSGNRPVVSRVGDEKELDYKEVGGNFSGGMMKLCCGMIVMVVKQR